MILSPDIPKVGIRYIAPRIGSGGHALGLYEPAGEEIKETDVDYVQVPDVVSGRSVYQKPLEEVREHSDDRIDLTQYITPKRYRFIDCMSFVKDEILRLWETQELSAEGYATISHVWKSLPPKEDIDLTKRGEFLVECEDRNDGGPISVDVLYWTAVATLQRGIRLLWSDRLCILRIDNDKGKEDKPWQIKQMFNIYKGRNVCFVLPAGLRRFTQKMEHTDWITRAWTFQEVVVPPIVEVLFTDGGGSPSTAAVKRMEVVQYFTMANRAVYEDPRRDGSAATREQFAQALQLREEFVAQSKKVNFVLSEGFTISGGSFSGAYLAIPWMWRLA